MDFTKPTRAAYAARLRAYRTTAAAARTARAALRVYTAVGAYPPPNPLTVARKARPYLRPPLTRPAAAANAALTALLTARGAYNAVPTTPAYAALTAASVAYTAALTAYYAAK